MGLLYNKKAKHIYKHIFNRFFSVFTVKTNLFLPLPAELGQEHEHELDCSLVFFSSASDHDKDNAVHNQDDSIQVDSLIFSFNLNTIPCRFTHGLIEPFPI